MSAPTEDEIQTQISQVVWIFEQILLFLKTNTPNFEGEYEEFVLTDLKGDFAPLSVGPMDDLRASLSAVISAGVVRSVLDPLLLEYGKQQNFPETEPDDIFDRLLVYFAEGSERVARRAFTYGAVSMGGGNTGDGTINRLTLDRYAHAIEAATPETKTLRCISDRNSGTQVHQELFEIRGVDIPRDFVAGIVGEDRVGAISGLSADDSLEIINNPSFHLFEGTAAVPTAITNWAVTTSIGNFVVVLTDRYRDAVHEGDDFASLRFEDNDKITQLLTVVRPTLDPLVPYYCQIAFKRENSCDGTLTIRVGANSKAVTLSAQSGWNVLRLDLDEKLFLRGFNATTLDIEVELASRTTGEVLVDDLIIAPMTRFDGTYYALVGGEIPFLVEDAATIADSISSDSINQRWFWRAYDKYLPHATGGSITWPDPT